MEKFRVALSLRYRLTQQLNVPIMGDIAFARSAGETENNSELLRNRKATEYRNFIVVSNRQLLLL